MSFTVPRDGRFETSARIVCDNRSVIFQTAETAVPRPLFQQILTTIAALRLLPAGPMLRIGARRGLSGCQQETCVPDVGLRGRTLAYTKIVDRSARL